MLRLRQPLLLLVLCLLSATSAIAAPTISSLTPSSAAVGASVTIAGTNFGSTQGTSTVKFNGTTASISSWSATSIVAVVPTGATTGNVVVTVSGTASNGKAFTILATASISSLTPNSGAVGASITIAGSNMGATQGTGSVKFNGTTATITSWSATSIVAKVPTGATTGNVVVNASGVNTNGLSFTVLGTPTISTLTPSTGAVGASVTIAGSNFGATQGTSTVKFNGTTASVSSWSDTSIIVTVPSGATTGNIVVHASGVDSAGKSFTVASAPSITSLSPTSGAAGVSVTITGTNFGSTQGTSTVKFNGTSASVTSWSATSIHANVPAGATTGNVVVHASGVDSNGKPFTVLLTPSITSLSPNFGPTGASVTINGSNFGASQGTSVITFAGWHPSVTSWADTSISVVVPDEASVGNGNVTVKVGTITSSPAVFNVLPTPHINSISPNSGGEKALVTIDGFNFGASRGTSTLTFNGTLATPCGTCWSDSEITVPVPAGATSGPLVIAVNGVQSNITNFNVATLSSISLDPTSPSIPPINTLQLTATGSYSDGSQQDLTTVVTWTSSATDVATISNAGSATSIAFGQTTIQAALGPITKSVTLTVGQPSFVLSGNVLTMRSDHTATTLNSGKVLVFGGVQSGVGVVPTAELYDPASGAFATTGSPVASRTGHTATLLSNGKVLITGGFPASGGLVSAAELYDPTTGTFAATGNMITPRTLHKAVLMQDGRVLILGGSGNSGFVSNAEIYDPASGTFSSTGNMVVPRMYAAAALLPNGKVLVCGGQDVSMNLLASAELFDPMTGAFSSTGNLLTARQNHSATLLGNGKVLVAAGDTEFVDASGLLASAELFDPSAGTFSATGSLFTPRTGATATLLANGLVMIDGGMGYQQNFSSAELYYPDQGTFSPTGPMTYWHTRHAASLLSNGQVLISGGGQDPTTFGFVPASELYLPTGSTAPPTLLSLAVDPLNSAIVAGTSQPFTATGVFADGSIQEMTKRVTWTSSVPSIATVASTGSATGVSPGTTIIAAVSGTKSGSTALAVDSIQLVSIKVNYDSIILQTGTQQFAAIGTYNDGTTQNLTSSVTWSSSATPIATINASGLASGVGVGSTSIIATVGTVQGSAFLYVVATLQSLSVTPGTGQEDIGATIQLAAMGTYSNGSSNVTPLSTWTSSNANVATVTGGGLVRGVASGSATVTATYNYFSSQFTASATITVTSNYAPPKISASTYPAQTFTGWTKNNTTVTFTCTPGGLPITSCTPPQTVTADGSGQIVTGSATDSAGTSASTSVTLYVDKTAPTLTVSPPGGTFVATSSPVTITGTVSDSGSGLSSVTCNGAQASFSAGSFSCSVGLSVGVNLVNVRAFDVAGNISASAFREILSGTPPAPNTLQITPSSVNLLIGNSRQFTAIDQNGQLRSDATWTTSDPTIATITSESQPTLKAVAAGQVTLTASVGGVSVQTQVTVSDQTSFTPGVALWSAPPVPGFTVQQIVQALPTRSLGMNLFSISASNDGNHSQVQAFSTDGQMLWQTAPSQFGKLLASPIADGFGGLLMTESCSSESPYMTTYDLDGSTGAILWVMQIPGYTQGGVTACPQAPKFAVRQDGSIVVANPLQASPRILVVDGLSGNILLNPPLPASTLYGNVSGSVSCDCFTEVGPPMVAPDGSAYVEYEVRQPNSNPNYVSTSLYLLKIGTDNSITTTQIGSNPTYNLIPNNIIPDGQGGILATWNISPNLGEVVDSPYQAVDVAPTGVLTNYTLPIKPDQLLLGETHFGQGNNQYSEMLISDGANITACGFLYGGATIGSGCVPLWTYQSGESPSASPSPINMLNVTQGNGLYATLGAGGNSANLLNFDPGGNLSTTVPTITAPSNGWQGGLFSAMNSTFGEVVSPQNPVADSFWSVRGGSQSGNGMAVEQVLSNQTQGPEKQLPNLNGPIYCPDPFVTHLVGPLLITPTCGNINAIELTTDKTPDFIFQKYIQTFFGNSFAPDGTWRNSIQLFTNANGDPVVNVTGPNQLVKIVLSLPASLGQAPFVVMTERFDPVNHVISVVTLKGHPLAGWRYWRVYSIGTNDIVIETGAYDQPGPGPANYLGYFLGSSTINKAWYQYLKVIQDDLQAPQGTNLQGAINGQQIYTYPNDHNSLLKGFWDIPGQYTNYILNNICQSTSCN